MPSLQLAAAESGTCHPLAAAQAISPAAGLPIPAAMEFHTEPGLGVSALVEGKASVAGQLRLVKPAPNFYQ